jgi:FKBP-type peptidyl-prolyl cis-trans isomerase FklB
MRKSLIAAVLLAGAMLVADSAAQQTPAAKTPTATSKAPAKKTTTASSSAAAPLTSRKDKFSYALGMNIATGLGANLKKQGVEVDWNILAQGLKDGASGGKTRLTEEEAKSILTEVQNDLRKEQQEKMKEAAAKNKTDGEAFLAANKTKEGVKTLPSGLQYKVITEGTGPKPTATDTVVCNYRGTLINGTEFDSSYKRGEPATFPVGGVIKGWTEALEMMPVGSKWQLFIPPDLAYGERGAGAEIGPDSTLIFEVELISIKSKEEDKTKDQKEEKKPEEKKPEDKKE